MYWFSRPPYARYGAALFLVVVALWVELRPAATVDHPFARAPVAAGSTLDRGLFEMRPVPPGILDPVEIDGVARRSVAAGAPLLPSDIDPDGTVIPGGWWTVEVPLPADTQRGDEVRVIVRPRDPADEAAVVDGLAVQIPVEGTDPFGFEGSVGLVAIPGDLAADVAAATGDRRVTVLVRASPER